ncbi:NAD(P)H-quinone oxidoreductase subunit i chloroplastic [Phtheirospermum japonicum]|uniref:NAD(P)H-quinone oxidoreductase subunit i chloroplastic n=1 Tax=Phtheirospermum japonicum TaxID=374723 RepID=A0A830DNJ6_9LAMI|nr:NAD(P)H-quinone oxidoreductase subunit i chloroplastic [Phtheirospermum japonicum]
MFPMLIQFLNSGQQTIRAARYIGQGFIITLSHANRLPVTIQYPYEKLITAERFRGRIHFEFDKCIACEVCVRVCPIDLHKINYQKMNNKQMHNEST